MTTAPAAPVPPGTVERPAVALSSAGLLATSEAALVAVAFSAEGEDLLLGPGAAELEQELGVDLIAVLEHHGATGRAGELVEHPLVSAEGAATLRTVAMVGVGAQAPADLRRAGAALARRAKGLDTIATSVSAAAADDGLRAFVEGVVLGSFVFHRRTTPPTLPVRSVVLAHQAPGDERDTSLARGLAAGRAGWRARELALVPSNEKTPAWIAERAQETAAERGLDIRVWDEKALVAQGFGGIVGVGQASDNPPRLVQLTYAPAKSDRRTPHIVLVGKGITFDTGGLSIKPADAMAAMKRDMTGAGVVLSVMEHLADIGCSVRVTGLLPCAENSISGRALRPGDVLRHYGGRTSEVTNTDAEGRLVLADALAYAARELDPTLLVDVATLTGAMKVSLGQRTGGFFATDDALADLLVAAGDASGEPLWRMPLVDDYEERLESSVADADNAPGSVGAITAALFLRHFTDGLPWAHLDIASVGDSPVDAFEWTAGATGFGARLLLRWLEQDDPLAKVARVRRR